MASSGCALIAGVKDGELAPDGGGGSGAGGATTSGTNTTTSGTNTTTSGTNTTTSSGTTSSTSSGTSVPHFQLVQAIHAGDVTTSTATTMANIGTGNLLVVGVFWDLTVGSIMSVGDSLGNTWHQALEQTHLKNPCTSTTHMQIWYAENVAGGMDTVSVTLDTGGQDLDFFLIEYSGVATVGALDAQGGQIGMTATNMMSVGLTTTQPDLIVGLFADTNGDTMTPGAGYESLTQSTYFSALIQDNLTGGVGAGSAPGMNAVTATLGSSNSCWAASAVAFRAK